MNNTDNLNGTLRKPAGARPRLPLAGYKSLENPNHQKPQDMPKKNQAKKSNRNAESGATPFRSPSSVPGSNSQSPEKQKIHSGKPRKTPKSELYPECYMVGVYDNDSSNASASSNSFASTNSSASSNRSWTKDPSAGLCSYQYIPESASWSCSSNEFMDKYSEISSSPATPSKTSQFARSQNWNNNRGPANSDYSHLSCFIICCILLPVLLTVYYSISSPNSDKKDVYSNSKADDLKTSFDAIGQSFPSQDKDIWISFATGIDDVITGRTRPAVFLLLALDQETTSCLAKKVAEVARSTLGGSGNVMVSAGVLENNISKVFTLVKERIEKTKAMVFSDISNIQPETLKAFHDICDPYAPLVDEAVYLLTIKSGKNMDRKEALHYVEQEIKSSFSHVIKEDTLKAIIVRITTGMVLPINAEESIPCA